VIRFFIERSETVHKSGFTSERYSYNSSTQLIQLPYEEDITTTSQVLNPQACVSALLVVLVFITTVTWIKNAIWGRHELMEILPFAILFRHLFCPRNWLFYYFRCCFLYVGSPVASVTGSKIFFLKG